MGGQQRCHVECLAGFHKHHSGIILARLQQGVQRLQQNSAILTAVQHLTAAPTPPACYGTIIQPLGGIRRIIMHKQNVFLTASFNNNSTQQAPAQLQVGMLPCNAGI